MLTPEEADRLLPIVIEADRAAAGLPAEQRLQTTAQEIIRRLEAEPWGRAMIRRTVQELTQNR